MPGVRLELLGGFQLYSADREPIILTARKSRGLLAYLALDMRRAHARDRLAALLWPDSGEMQARTSLRQALTALRRALGEGADALIATRNRQASSSGSAAERERAAWPCAASFAALPGRHQQEAGPTDAARETATRPSPSIRCARMRIGRRCASPAARQAGPGA